MLQSANQENLQQYIL